MTAITHAAIVQRIADIEHEKDAAVALLMSKRKNERLSLQELCGGLGHMMSAPLCSTDEAWGAEGKRMWSKPRCVICEHQPRLIYTPPPIF